MKYSIAAILILVSCLAHAYAQQTVAVTQDTAGNYNFQYQLHGHSRSEQATGDGNVVGSYSFIDGNGILQTVHYTAGIGGFRAIGTNLPAPPLYQVIPVDYTPEVAAARAAHFAKLKELGGIF